MSHKNCFRISLLVCFCAFFALPLCNAQPSKPLPQAVIDHTTFKFAPVIAGTEVTHIFHIQNKGNAVLKIPGVYSG